MTVNIKKIFYPGIGVELVFNPDSYTPEMISSIIFECSYQDSRIIISQTTPPVKPSGRHRDLALTTLYRNKKHTLMRMGLSCKIESLINQYRLTGSNTTAALILSFDGDPFDANIRSAYRLTPDKNYTISGRMDIKNRLLHSGDHFKIHNISISGLGLLIPKLINKSPNPLLKLRAGMDVEFDLIMKNMALKKIHMPIHVGMRIRRVDTNYNKVCGFVGLSFTNINPEDEENLSKFIHDAQLYRIRKKSGY